jgi:hypothetical protein
MRALSLVVKRLGHEADCSPPSSAEVKNAWKKLDKNKNNSSKKTVGEKEKCGDRREEEKLTKSMIICHHSLNTFCFLNDAVLRRGRDFLRLITWLVSISLQ